MLLFRSPRIIVARLLDLEILCGRQVLSHDARITGNPWNEQERHRFARAKAAFGSRDRGIIEQSTSLCAGNE
jgi:hypothetical protein